MLAQIHNHEYVIGYVEHGKINGAFFLVMEYVEGANLKLLMTQNDPVLAENIGNLLIDSALALEHVTQHGEPRGELAADPLALGGAQRGARRGTRARGGGPRGPSRPLERGQLARLVAVEDPEQLLRQPFDHRVDIFAYGVTAYELLTGRKPFAGESPQDILRRQLDRSLDFVLPRELNPDIPAGLEKIILKCLERDMEKRYPYMSVLVRDLQTTLYI